MQKTVSQSTPESILAEAGFVVRLSGISALDRYYRSSAGSVIELETTADLIALSTLFDNIDFPGEERIDAVIETGYGFQYNLRIIDSENEHSSVWAPLHFYYYPGERKFIDVQDQYQQIRKREQQTRLPPELFHNSGKFWQAVADLAEIVARYDWELVDTSLVPQTPPASTPTLGSREQRKLLIRLIESPNPGKGFAILMNTGFVHTHWPLLAAMQGISQDKDYHPEGDVWNHTLEMYRYVKVPDTELGMSILLHDCGKAFSRKQNNNEFDRHSQIGAERGVRFLQGLGFPGEFIEHVGFMVKNHMLPAHIVEIPHRSIDKILSDPLFPKLLELYRCDISSSFRDPEGYYRACEAYRRFKKNKRNPYRMDVK